MSKRIKQSSARSLTPLRPFIPEDSAYEIGVPISEIAPDRLERSGCPRQPKLGDAFLPRVVGPHTHFNANGREEVLKDGTKETVYRMVNSSWEDWHGNSHSGIVSRPYERWPRIQHPGRSEHLCVIEVGDQLYLASDTCRFTSREGDRNLHVLNVFLESFGECEIIGADGALLAAPRIRKNNWDMLPPGKYPWDRAKQAIERITSQLKSDERAVIEYRMKCISKSNPDTLAVGRGGFHGYFAFGFSKLNLFVLESIHLDNATYVFGTDWDQISQLSKAEIIRGGQHKARIVHDRGWKHRLSRLINA